MDTVYPPVRDFSRAGVDDDTLVRREDDPIVAVAAERPGELIEALPSSAEGLVVAAVAAAADGVADVDDVGGVHGSTLSPRVEVVTRKASVNDEVDDVADGGHLGDEQEHAKGVDRGGQGEVAVEVGVVLHGSILSFQPRLFTRDLTFCQARSMPGTMTKMITKRGSISPATSVSASMCPPYQV